MSCFSPIKGFRTTSGVVFSELRRHDIIGSIEIPCGQCIGCRMRRASDWTLRCMHEASLHESNCFVTLTYGRDRLPPDGSLCHRDFQLFLKRLRFKRRGSVIRYYMCGEYGELNKRPHYHAILFGADFRDRVPTGKSGAGVLYYDSAELRELWTHGRVSVQDCTRETAGYCTRYIMHKQLGTGGALLDEWIDEDGVVHGRIPEYSAMSLKPGIGAGWFERFKRDVYPHDFCIAEGTKYRPPKYYDKLYGKIAGVEFDDMEFKRELRARESVDDNTPERRKVREQVFLAKVSKLKRSFES